MTDDFYKDPIMEMFIFETTQLLQQLEEIIINSEKESCYQEEAINEIFRIMHTIKGSSAMMSYDNMSILAHSIEDLFYFIREKRIEDLNCSKLSDLVLESGDFIKVELEKIKNDDETDGEVSSLIDNINEFLQELRQGNILEEEVKIEKKNTSYEISNINDQNSSALKNEFEAAIFFEDGCEMENVRSFAIINELKEIANDINHNPEQLLNNEQSIDIIKKNGFNIFFKSNKTYEEIHNVLMQTVFIKELKLKQLNQCEFEDVKNSEKTEIKVEVLEEKNSENKSSKKSKKNSESQNVELQSIISVKVNKLDKLMDLVGELVISESMVTQNPDLQGLTLDNFQKASHRLNKIICEIQDMVMSIRMVPLTATFNKMNRIVRDMSKKLNKEVRLEIIGEETEVDKNIIEHISDPLMHLIRNSIDHGIESNEERKKNGKTDSPKVTLEAKNAGGEVFIIVKDNGKGLNKEHILKKARENGLISKPENYMTNKEIYSLILLPGFSTKSEVTEFSGRGVGMDVVLKNIEAIGGSILIDSILGQGTIITLKLPLTLAIINGMNVKVGNSRYTIPTTSIKQSFRAKKENIIIDTDGNEMIMVRGQCYEILRLHKFYKMKTNVVDISEGIIVMVENDGKSLCIFADKLLGEQQVVVKSLPNYINKIKGLTGCTLLGDGSISLILDIGSLINN